LTNWRQKVDNVKGAFRARAPEFVAGRVLLLIDDIYDSGYILREVAQTLKQAGASSIYPLTITRTAHSDDQ
jgi:predicted amidophosphoribosyltransferase